MLTATEAKGIRDEVWGLYQASFSDVEKIPRENLQRAMGRGASLVEYRDNGRFVGFTFCFSDRDMSFLVYFATASNLRGRGYGASILELFRSMNHGKRIFLVTEPCDEKAPDYDMRVRRQGFYRRNGCKDTGKTIVSDDEIFDTMLVQGYLSNDEMESLVGLYEDIHNGRM